MAECRLFYNVQIFNFHDHPAVIAEILDSGYCPMCLLKGEEIPVGDLSFEFESNEFESNFLNQECPKCSTLYICDDY